MNNTLSRRAISIICLGLVVSIAQAASNSNLRGARYCEIIASKTIPHFAVYNTIGLNDCPEDVWSKISPRQVKKEIGSTFVHLNGPRYWVIDGFEHSNLVSPTVKDISGLKMREAGVLHLSMRDMLKPNKAYQTRDVNRQTTWVYQAGKPVYELIDPQGTVYVMQSYSVQRTAQTPESLAELGAKLQLPAGWKFKTGVLSQTQNLQAVDGMAIVVQDDFLNTYQKAAKDFL